MKPAWFPDWSQSICAVIGGGESVRRDEVEALRGHAKVIAVNRSHELAPWADVLYAADRAFWDVFAGVRQFKGLKVTPNHDAAVHFRLREIELVELNAPLEDSLSLKPGTLARGGHSGHQAINLAVQFGSLRIMLLGFDFFGEHWHGRHEFPLRNPKQTKLDEWRRTMDTLAPTLAALGIEVVNCSQISKLTAYPKMTAMEALARWSETLISRQTFCDLREQQTQQEITRTVPQLV